VDDGPTGGLFAPADAGHSIVAFEIPITRLEGKLKLSQNRSAEDRRRVVEALSASDDANAQAVGAMIRERQPDS
jgi:predicted FMN-binding regulatory protein PaiB